MNEFPTILLGFVEGFLRLENENGDFYTFKFPILLSTKAWYVTCEQYGIPHIQYKSHFGFLFSRRPGSWWPFCFHFWIMWKLQTPGIPGSEQGIYFRTPGERWIPSTESFEWTNGYVGGHWD